MKVGGPGWASSYATVLSEISTYAVASVFWVDLVHHYAISSVFWVELAYTQLLVCSEQI